MNDYASLARRLEGALGAIEVVGVVIQVSDRDAPHDSTTSRSPNWTWTRIGCFSP